MAASKRAPAGARPRHSKFTLNMPPHLHAAACGVAQLKGIPMTELVREAVRQYVLQHAPTIRQELEALHAAAEYRELTKPSEPD